jgi:hypothetical protein
MHGRDEVVLAGLIVAGALSYGGIVIVLLGRNWLQYFARRGTPAAGPTTMVE